MLVFSVGALYVTRHVEDMTLTHFFSSALVASTIRLVITVIIYEGVGSMISLYLCSFHSEC